MKKRVVSALLALTLLFSASFAKGSVLRFKVGEAVMTEDGKERALDSSPVVISGRTLCPVRAVAEGLGGSAEFSAETNTVLLRFKGTIIRLTVGSQEAFSNGRIFALDSPPV